MKKILALAIILSISLSLISCMPNLKKFAVSFADDKAQLSASDVQSEEYREFLASLEDFSARLSVGIYGERGIGSNFCVSPVAIYMQLAVACECADTQTREEILDALGMTYEQVRQFTSYIYSLSNCEFTYTDESDKTQVISSETLSSSIWLDTSLMYSPTKVGALASVYNTDVYAASFSGGDASKMINQYIEYKSGGAVSGNMKFTKTTALALISALSLEEIWNGLGKNLTETLETYDFVESDGNTVKLQMLRSGYANGRTIEEESFSSFFIETEHGFKLHFLLPKDGYQLKKVFTAENISRILSVEDYGYLDSEESKLHHTRVIFPSFDASFSGDVSSVMTNTFGVKSLFDPELCDLSGITSAKAYCVSLPHASSISIGRSGIGDVKTVTLAQSPSHQGPDYYEDVYHELMIDRAFGFVLTDTYGTIVYSGVISNFE